jgi:hypothetical protein
MDEARAKPDDAAPLAIDGVSVLGPQQRWTIAGLLFVLVCLVWAVRLAASGAPTSGSSIANVLCVVIVAVAFLYAGRTPTVPGPAATLRVDRSGLRLADSPLLAREAIRSIDVLPWPGGYAQLLVIERDGRRVALRLPSIEAAQSAREALGFGRAVTRFDIDGRTYLSPRGFWRHWLFTLVSSGLFIVMIGAAEQRWPWLARDPWSMLHLGSVFWPALLIFAQRKARATVGADGIELRGVGHRSFLAARTLLRAEAVARGEGRFDRELVVVLRLRDGTTKELVIAKGMGLGSAQSRAQLEQRTVALARCVNEMLGVNPDLERSREEAAASIDASMLGRAARTVPEWIAALRALAEGTDTFREDVRSRVTGLLRVAEDVSAREVVRAAAAVAASRAGDDQVRRRVAALAEGTVAPRLRATFEALQQADDGRLRAALEALEAADEQAEAERASEAAAPRRRPTTS